MYNMDMDADSLRAYPKRWQAVAEIEREEARTASYELRWQQLNALAALAAALNISPAEDVEEEAARARWRRLRQML